MEGAPARQDAEKSVSQLETASDLQKKLDSLKRGRAKMERQWKINLAFYKGNQYVYYNKDSRRLESLATEDGEKPRWRIRLVSNQIMTGSHSMLSKMLKTKPVMTATPSSGSDHEVKAAQLAESLLEHWWKDLHLDERLDDAMLWAVITGQGFWKISWDAHAGKSMRFLLSPDGQPILHDSLKELFRGQLEQLGVPPQEQVTYMGDVKVETISPFHVYLDPSAAVLDDAKFVICTHFLSPEEILTRWKYEAQADSVAAAPDETLPMSNALDAAEKNVAEVNIGYFLPTASLPNGRYVVWLGGDQKAILEDGPWPYPFQ